MTPDNLMKLIDDYACEVANIPSMPTLIEKKLATERIERARNVVVTELAKPAPTQPVWHDAPTQPGLWVAFGIAPVRCEQKLIDAFAKHGSGVRWFGPLPEDTK